MNIPDPKELYIQIVEELMDEKGLTYDEASEKAYPMLQERIADYYDAMDRIND